MAEGMGSARWIEAGGIRTRYFLSGDGPPIVLIHGGEIGAAPSGAMEWLACFELLSRTCRVLAFDRLGMGGTGCPLRDEDYTLAASSAHAAHLIGATLGRRVHLVAHGSGARIALDLCFGAGVAVASCSILNSATITPGVTELVPRPSWSDAWDAADQALEHYRSLCAPGADIAAALVREACGIGDLDSMKQARAKMRDQGLRRHVYLRELAAGRGAMFRRLAEDGVRCPVLLVNGADDPLVSDECAALLVSAFAARQQDVELHLIADCGHYPQLEKGELVAGLVAGFIAAHAA